MVLALWLDPEEFPEADPIRSALLRLEHRFAAQPATADLCLSAAADRAREAKRPWVAIVTAGDESAAAEAYAAGAVEVLRWPAPDALVQRTLTVATGTDTGATAALRAELDETADRLAKANETLQSIQKQVVMSEKMASLGMMVAGIAHEINTPLGAIASMQHTLERALEKLRKDLPAAPAETKAHKLLHVLEEANRTIRTGTQRVTTIVKRLRAFARLDEAELKPCNLHEALNDTLLLMHHELKHGFTIDKSYGDLPTVACFASRITQVFLNLLMNAKQASAPPSTITIRTGTEPGYVWVAISDQGGGIAEEHLAKIFEPGFTTKGVGVGVGLGLSICHQIVEEHFGRIEVESEVGKGTTFTVWIPTNIAQRREQTSEAPTLPPDGPFGPQ